MANPNDIQWNQPAQPGVTGYQWSGDLPQNQNNPSSPYSTTTPFNQMTSASSTAHLASQASSSSASSLDAQFQKMLAALASGNAQAFDEAKREFNVRFDESKREYDLGRGDSLDQFAKTFGMSAAGLTGMYNGSPTLDATKQAQQNALGVADRTGVYTAPGQSSVGAGGGESVESLLARNPSLGDPAYQKVLMDSRGFVFWPGENLQNGRPTAGAYPTTPGAPAAAGAAQGGTQTLASLLQQAQLSGQYNGNPTEAARQFNVTSGQQNLRDQASLGTSLLNAATQIRGPQDYLQYQQLTHGGQNLMQQLYGNQQIPQGGAPTGQLQSANLGTVLGDIGWNPQGQQQPNPQQQLLQRFGLQPGQGQQQLSPNQIDPARWDAMGAIGQSLTKNLAETYGGYDANDFEAQINKTRPIGTAARQTTSAYGAARGIY